MCRARNPPGLLSNDNKIICVLEIFKKLKRHSQQSNRANKLKDRGTIYVTVHKASRICFGIALSYHGGENTNIKP